MKKLILLLLVITSCKKDSVEETKPITLTVQSSTYTVKGTNIHTEINGQLISSGEYTFTLNIGDSALIYSDVTCATYLNPDATIKGTYCPTNEIKVYQNNNLIGSQVCNCQRVEYKIKK